MQLKSLHSYYFVAAYSKWLCCYVFLLLIENGGDVWFDANRR